MSRLGVMWFVVALSSGCGGAGSMLRARDESIEARASRLVERAVSVAARRSETPEAVVTTVRWNPAACECPGWEARLWGRWVRVGLEVPDEAGLTVPAQDASNAEVPAARRRVTLSLTDDIVESSTGWRYPVWRVVSVEPLRGPGATSGTSP